MKILLECQKYRLNPKTIWVEVVYLFVYECVIDLRYKIDMKNYDMFVIIFFKIQFKQLAEEFKILTFCEVYTSSSIRLFGCEFIILVYVQVLYIPRYFLWAFLWEVV